MHLLFLTNFLKEEIMRAICWTLIHSLWQGILLAFAAGAVMLFTKGSTSTFRYNFLAVLFFVFVAASGYTFLREMQSGETISAVGTSDFATGIMISGPQIISPIKDGGQNYFDKIIFYFNEHAPLVVTIWFIIFSFRFVKLLANLIYIQKVRYSKTHDPSSDWKLKMQKLARRLGIKRPIILLESEIIKVPVMVGVLKPVILFPFSMLSQLPPEQVEAVMLHELAHIKRKDYFVNLLQNFAEIVFFFNPAVLWISSLIRDERENCCDDMAIRQTKSKEKFINALVAFQEYNLSSSYAIGFPGQKNHLLNRVKRIITNKNKTLNNMEKIVLATGIVIVGFFTISFAQTQQSIRGAERAESPAPPPVPALALAPGKVTLIDMDTVPSPKKVNKVESKTFLSISKDGKDYKIVEVNGKITEMYVNGKKIPDDKISEYKPVIAEVKEKQMEQAEKFDELRVQKEILDQKDIELKSQLEEMNSEQKEKMLYDKLALENLERTKKELIFEQQKLANKDYQGELAQNEKNLSEIIAKLEKKNLDNSMSNAQMKELLDKQVVDAKLQVLKAQAESEAVVAQSARSLKLNKPIVLIIAELKDMHIIDGDENLSFTLNNDEFIVNGVKQPAEVHQKFKDQYIKSPKDHVIYSGTKNSSQADVYIE